MEKIRTLVISFLFVVMIYALMNFVIVEKSVNIGYGKVVKNNSLDEFSVEIEGEEIVTKVFSNIFDEDDNLFIEYVSKNGDISITKIKTLYDTDEQKIKLINRISSDQTLLNYKSKVNSDNLIFLHVLPVSLSEQTYDVISPYEYIELKYQKSDMELSVLNNNETLTINVLEKFSVVSIENIKSDGTSNKITFIKDENSFTVDRMDGFYSAKIKFENGDILNYIFM